jgi:hypothetical protein
MRSARRYAIAVIAAALLFGAGGCGSAEEPELLNDLANRLDRAGDLSFTAEYRVGDSGRVVIAQTPDPPRAAYVHPGGKAVFTETEVATCTDGAGGARCTLTPPPSPGTDPTIDLLVATASSAGATAGTGAGADQPALINPATALRLVSAAMLDGDPVTRYESTIASEPVTCVGTAGADGFDVCITASGLLGRFTGTIGGAPASVELTSFTTTADAELFRLPKGATIDDRRAELDPPG